MTPYKQLLHHDPAAGISGDCWRTCIGCLLDMAPGDVPHFMEGLFDGPLPEAVHRRVQDWFASRGQVLFEIALHGDRDELLAWLGGQYPGLHHMFSGRSRTGCNHAVIVRDGRIIHDPAHGNPGIVGPCDDGYFRVGVIGVRL